MSLNTSRCENCKLLPDAFVCVMADGRTQRSALPPAVHFLNTHRHISWANTHLQTPIVRATFKVVDAVNI